MLKVPAALLTFLAAQQSAAHAKPSLPLLSSARRMQQQDEYEWKLLNENNHGRYDHSAAFDDTERKMYIFGGYRRTSRYSRTSLRDLRVWDAQADEWTTLESARYTRYGHTAVFDSTEKEMYVHGGIHSSSSPATMKYSVEANTWTRVYTNSGPQRRYYHAAAFDGANRLMYVLGGHTSWSDRQRLWVLNVQAARWSYTSCSYYYCDRQLHTAVLDSDTQKMYVYGGSGYGTRYPFVEYSVQARRWRTLAAGPGRRYGHTAAFDSARKEMYLHGGYYGRYYRDTWKYSVEDNAWTKLSDAASNPALYTSTMVMDAAVSKLYLYGGRSSTGYSVDKLWEFEFQGTTTSTTVTTTTVTTTTSSTTTTTTCDKTGRGPPSPEELQGEGRGPPTPEEWMCLPHEGEPPRGPGNNNGNGNDEPPSGSGNNNGNGNGNDGGN